MTTHPSTETSRRDVLRGWCALGAATSLGALGSVIAGPARAQAQTFPSRPVRIVPFGSAGGPIDHLARVYAEKLQVRWAQPFIVDARPGASGIIAADYVAKSAPDGHTVMFTLPLSHVNQPILQPKMPYDPVKDFEPLVMLGTGGPALVARADAPYNDLKGFIEFARKQSKGLTFGTWGNGSTAHLFGELLQRETGANLVHVAYKSESAAHIDMFGSAIDFAWANPATARAQVQAGKMKVIGVTGSKRLSALPGVATFADQGFKGFDIDSWIGVYAPARTPQPVIDTWVSALNEVTAMPDVTAKLISLGFEPQVGTPAQFAARYRADYPRMEQLIKASGVTAQ